MDREAAHRRLRYEVEIARNNSRAASERFAAINGELPSDIPYPDSTDRIRGASREYSVAREALMVALQRLNNFVINGVIPEDLS